MSDSVRTATGAPPATARAWPLAALAIPIFIPMLSQNVRLLVDTIMVGRLGPEAIAAQGMTGYLIVLLLAPLMALANPVQAFAARAKGSGNLEGAAAPLRTAIALSAIGGTLYGIVLFLIAKPLMGLLAAERGEEIAGAAYLEPVVLAAPFTGVVSACYGFWVALARPSVNLVIELVTQFTNAALGYVLIFGVAGAPALGIHGAGIAFALSTALGGTLYLISVRKQDVLRVTQWASLIKSDKPLLIQTWENLRLSFQHSLSFFALYFMIQFIGTRELAGFTVLIRLATVLVYPAQALARAAATLAGQAIGRGDRSLADAWVAVAMRVTIVCTGLLGVPFWLFPHEILMLLTAAPEVAEVATLPLRILGVSIIFSGVGFLLGGILAATGAAAQARRINFLTQWILLVPAVLIVGPFLGLGLTAVWIVQSLTRVLLTYLSWRAWGSWRAAGFKIAK